MTSRPPQTATVAFDSPPEAARMNSRMSDILTSLVGREYFSRLSFEQLAETGLGSDASSNNLHEWKRRNGPVSDRLFRESGGCKVDFGSIAPASAAEVDP
ncbi:hypothetical protein EMEDMD4_790312 [Sinorhizobium medicae]|uniref:Uncharacterized protein n=1 Tax=Sinorhizobium medicae TaxID=110321 RepID=A0A508XAY9_9HYPH|nr:hypothetical protein EMEDMD4_790312 [Sinorhizobium medicae]